MASFATLLAAAHPAAAPAKGAAPVEGDAIKAAASDLFDRGVKAMDEQRWEDCRASFLAAWNIHRHYQIAGNLAACEAKLGRYVDAAEHLSFSMREMPATAPPEWKALAEKLMQEVRPKVAEITIRVSRPDAELSLDGRSLGRAPLSGPVFVEPGSRQVLAKLGGVTKTTTFVAKAGGSQEVTLVVEDATPPKGEGPRKELWISGAAIAGAGVIAGAVLLGVAEAKKSEAVVLRDELLQSGGPKVCEIPSNNPKCTTFQSALDTRYAAGNAAGWAFVGAGAVTALTVAYVLITRANAPPPVQAAVVVGPQGGGALLGASF